MKSNFKFAVMTLVLATSFGFASAMSYAQTTAPGPYYATPSWDQTLPASTRFIVLSNWNNEAVLDRETGLVWQRSPIGEAAWAQASENCINARTGGRGSWRLPTINELSSLFDPTLTTSPFLPAGHPFTGLPPPFGLGANFWSSTLSALDNNSNVRAVKYQFSSLVQQHFLSFTLR